VHNMTSVNLVHSQLGLTGAGVRVGVIDDGVDYTHPALGGCFGGPSCRIQYGYDLVGNNFDPDSEDPAKKPSPQPTPYTTCGSHGTHTTGIVGGTHMTNGFSGVAPGVALGVYRVFGCGASPQTDAEVIVMAMQAAYRDGMNVINLSIGGGSAWPEYPTAAAGSYLSSRGTIVVGSAGNDGPMGAWDIGAPGVGRQVLGVSSYENTKYRMQHSIRLSSNPARFVGHADPADKRRKITTWNNVPIVPLVDSSGSNLACGNITMNLSGAVGIVARGTCMFTTKAKNLAMAPGGSGALGLIIYNNEPGPLFMAFKDDNFTFPVIGVTEDEGKYLLEQINQATATTGYPPRITETDTPVFYDNPGGDTVSSFSSYGPGPWLDFKPDLGAPGGLIFSTLPNATYGIKSGTSMAAPYIAGSVALVMQSMGTDRPFEFYASRLVTTAVQKQKFNYTPSAIETAARQGGGLVNVYDAITNRIHVEPSRISFNDTGPFRDFNKPRVVRVYNWHDTAVSFAVNHVTAQSMASYFPNGTFAAKPLFSSALGATATILATPLTFTVSPGGFADVSLFAVPPTDLNPAQWWIYSGYIRLTPTAVTANKPYSTKSTLATLNPIHVPYIGMKGNYRAMPIFDFDVAGKYPSLLSVKTKKPPLPSPVAPFLPVFTMVDRDLVAVGVRNLHPTRQLNVRVLDAATNTSLGFIEDGYQKWYGRNDHSPGNAVTWFVWKGGVIQGVDRPDGPDNLFGAKSVNTTAEARPVPDGTYRLKVEALRPFGDLSNPDEYETWVSNPFVV
ncbi:subtilisin-like protein, partial [Ramicandelaber brevisporus]